MDDLISRQDAIGKVKDWMKFIGYSHCERNVMECTIQMLEELPSAQSEIIRCNDCRHLSHRNGGHCDVWDWYISNDAFYCGCGERKTDE